RESRVDTGNVYKRPLKRARTTFQYLAVAVFGTQEDKRIYKEEVTRIHRMVHSTPASRVRYSAMDPELQMWVAACLYVGFEDVYLWLHGPMSAADNEAFYQSAQTLGTTLQVRPAQWPATSEAFDDYWEEAKKSIHFAEPGGRASVPAVPAGDGGAQPTAAGAGPDRHLPGTAGRDAVARADRARAHVSRGGGGRRVERAAARGSGLAGGLLLVPHPGALEVPEEQLRACGVLVLDHGVGRREVARAQGLEHPAVVPER